MRILTIAILTLAVASGGYLRFANLGAREMSADEGASWAAAVVPSATEVLHLQSRLNPGELGVHDLALHGWIRVFGDSIGTMRALSATAGTIAIILVFFVTREILLINITCADEPTNSAPGALCAEDRDGTAAFSALVFAVNLVTIKYSREARMYPLALALVLAQVWFFLRAIRRGGLANYAAAAIFTSASIAANFTMSLILLPEGIWLLYVLWKSRAPRQNTIGAGIALAAGLILLVPGAIMYVRARGGAPDPAVYDWISPPALWAPVALFNKATGSVAFPVMALLAIWGLVRGWRRIGDSIAFAMLWMFAAPLLLLIVSYVIRPAFVERYVIACFVPFFVLIALGAWEIGRNSVRLGALALVAVLALGHIVSYERKPHDAQWREAVRVAVENVRSGDWIAVAPKYAVNVVRYYLPQTPSAPSPRPIGDQPRNEVVIIADTGVAPAEAERIARDYPHPLAHLRGLGVRSR
jgi:mannosyltransferase